MYIPLKCQCFFENSFSFFYVRTYAKSCSDRFANLSAKLLLLGRCHNVNDCHNHRGNVFRAILGKLKHRIVRINTEFRTNNLEVFILVGCVQANWNSINQSLKLWGCRFFPDEISKTVGVDADGNIIATDTQTMTSKAGFFQKIIAFFKKLFGMTKVYPEIFKGIF